jgi:3-deoxy-D-manno-octulosonic-acid transferase
MFWLYNVLWLLALPVVLGYLIVRRLFFGKYRQSLGPRLGFGIRGQVKPRSPKVIWVQALSVGEVLSAISLIRTLREHLPDYDVVVTTTTESGQSIARLELTPLNCHFFYLPLDFWPVVRRMVNGVGASIFVLVETDLWPNLFWCLAGKRTPIVLVNGRLLDRSFPRYWRLRKFFYQALRHINALCMQSQEDARRMRMLGIEAGRIRVTGNLKFDQPLLKKVSDEREEVIRRLGWVPPQFTWIVGSTHPGEEEIILRVYSRLRQHFPELCLVLAPRRQGRFDEVFLLAKQTGWQTRRRSQLPGGRAAPDSVDVLILDTIGELASFYSLGNFAFLGGSLVTFGGHNPLEAARRGLPVIFGPYMQNFREIAKILTESGGGFQVADETELFLRMERWLASPEECREQGEKARAALLAHQGAVARSVEVIQDLLRVEREGH